MLKTTPKKCIEDFLNGYYVEKNYNFLIPVYEKLFKDIGRKIDITEDFKNQIEILKKYFSYVLKIKKENKINFNNDTVNKKELVEELINLIDENELNKAINALKEIIDFLCRNRTNINGLEIISWSLFGKTTLDDIKNIFINDDNGADNIKTALLGFDFNSLLIEYDGFSDTLISDLLIPVELINPKRRQGLFDKEVFKLISMEIKKYITDFQFETELNDLNERSLRNNTNWLITEKITNKIKFTLPKNAQKIDMLCKIKDLLFIGTHKEQQAGGGAQDNQAVDASFLFNYRDDELKEIKKIFNVKQIYLCIFLERGKTKLTSSHWKKIIEMINERNNKDKYLLSSVQFIDLIKNEV